MHYGSTLELNRKGNRKRPSLLCVFQESLLVVEPPAGKPSTAANVERHVLLIARAGGIINRTAVRNKDLTGATAAFIISNVEDRSGRPVHVEILPARDITSVRVYGERHLGCLRRQVVDIRVTRPIRNAYGPFVFTGTPSSVHRFLHLISRPLGERLVRC